MSSQGGDILIVFERNKGVPEFLEDSYARLYRDVMMIGGLPPKALVIRPNQYNPDAEHELTMKLGTHARNAFTGRIDLSQTVLSPHIEALKSIKYIALYNEKVYNEDDLDSTPIVWKYERQGEEPMTEKKRDLNSKKN